MLATKSICDSWPPVVTRWSHRQKTRGFQRGPAAGGHQGRLHKKTRAGSTRIGLRGCLSSGKQESRMVTAPTDPSRPKPPPPRPPRPPPPPPLITDRSPRRAGYYIHCPVTASTRRSWFPSGAGRNGTSPPAGAVAAIAARIASCAAADLALGDLATNIVFRSVGVERNFGPFECHQQLGCQQAVEGDEPGLASEDAIEAWPQGGLALAEQDGGEKTDTGRSLAS